jgi:ABC-type polysaccharide/polyol phosphate transport system ATPase subunit
LLKTSDPTKPAPRIVVDDAHKDFTLRHTHSIKESFLAAVRRKPLTTQFHALDGISFDIQEGEAVALLGFNGSGKSTTLKLISGVLTPDKGRVLTRGRVAGLIEVGAGFHPDLSGRENIFLNAAILGMSKEETQARYDEIVAFSEIEQFIDTEVKHYSSGMFLRLAFSVAIHTEVDVLLIDEILSVGDEPFQRKCLARIREMHAAGKTLVVVSHDLNMVAKLCERGIVLKDGRIVFDGPSAQAVRTLRGLGNSPFADIPRDHEAFDHILAVADAGVLPTVSDESGARTFDAAAPVTGATFARAARVLLDRDGTGGPGAGALTDAAALEWFHAKIAGERVELSVADVLSRATLADALFALRGAPQRADAPSPFADVPDTHPSAAAIGWLYDNGLSKGWPSELGQPLYRPHEPVVRETLMTFLARFAKLSASTR